MLPEVFWQSVGYSSLLVEDWGGEFTVFQPGSGKTHFLNHMGLQVILTLSQSPVSENELCRIIADQFQQTFDQDFFCQIIKTLNRFDELGLIEKVKMEPSKCG